MGNVKYWIVFRYNIGVYFTRGDKAQEWMDDRYVLFTKYTLPSLKRQTDTNFTIALLFDVDTPKKEIAKIVVNVDFCECRTYRIHWPEGFFPVPSKGVVTNRQLLKYSEKFVMFMDFSEFIADIRSSSEYSIQTRLDNDDALMPGAIERIKAAVVDNSTCAIDILGGYMVDTINRRAYESHHPFGTPFISLYQNNADKIKCIYDQMHHKVGKMFSKICIEEPPLWIMIIHNNNTTNRIVDSLIRREINYERFARSYL